MITVIGNLKGGTGKSTVTFNLAVWLRLAGLELTVVDLDPQKTLTDVDALRQEQGTEPALRVQSGPFSDLSLPRDADEILIDVGTADLESFKQALMVADRVLIPVCPSQADIWSTQRFIRFLDTITHGRPPEAVTFINRADTNRTIPASDEATAALTALPGVRLIPQRLCNRTVFRDSFSEGLAVFELEPRGRGSREFRALASALYSQKRRAAQGGRRRAGAAGNPNVGFRHGSEALPVDPDSVKDAAIGEGEAPAATGRDGPGGLEGSQERREAQAGGNADKRKGRKKLKKAKKHKPAGKNKKGKKHKKASKAKKANKTKKGKDR